MNEQNYEQEISIGKMLYRVFRDWRKVFVIALVIGVLVGLGNFAIKRIKIADPEYITEEEQNFERELAAFEAQGETLQREIANLEDTRAEQQEYNENSILMKINPFREFNASLQLYVSTDYQINPELTYQNIDLSNRILRSYVTYMVNGDMYQYILDHLATKVELRYLREILSISADYDTYMITMSVRNVDEASCREILNYAIEGIQAKKDEIVTSIGEHRLETINQSVYENVNLDLDELQKANQQYVLDLGINLQEKNEDYIEWKETPKPQKSFTVGRIIKNSIKMMIFGFIIGAVLAAVFIAFSYIMSDKLQDAKELKNRFGLRVIAELPKVHKKRVWVGFDRLFAQWGGLQTKESDYEQLAKVAACTVKAELDSIKEDKEPCKLAFTGNITVGELDAMLQNMKWESDYSAKSVPNILIDPSAVSKVTASDYVILVEKQEESTYSKIEKELEVLKAWKKKVLGVIVVGVDAVP